jgi:hypothetical protein
MKSLPPIHKIITILITKSPDASSKGNLTANIKSVRNSTRNVLIREKRWSATPFLDSRVLSGVWFYLDKMNVPIVGVVVVEHVAIQEVVEGQFLTEQIIDTRILEEYGE